MRQIIEIYRDPYETDGLDGSRTRYQLPKLDYIVDAFTKSAISSLIFLLVILCRIIFAS